MIEVKIKGLDAIPDAKVGDKVEFQIGEETHTDVVTYVMGHVIEGEKYDLTYVNFTIKK
jgi:hypothetical protein